MYNIDLLIHLKTKKNKKLFLKLILGVFIYKQTTMFSNYKQQKKREIKWTRIVKKWGYSDAALDALYDEGDERHGAGFRAFMDSIVVHRDTSSKKEKCDTQGRFDVLERDNIPQKMSFADIQREQAMEGT